MKDLFLGSIEPLVNVILIQMKPLDEVLRAFLVC